MQCDPLDEAIHNDTEKITKGNHANSNHANRYIRRYNIRRMASKERHESDKMKTYEIHTSKDIWNLLEDLRAGLGSGVSIVKVSRGDKQRSNPENRYFHGYIVPKVAKLFDISFEDAKDHIKDVYFREKIIVGDYELQVTRSTSYPTTVEFEEKMTRLRMDFVAEYGLYLLRPNEVPREEYE